MQEACAHLWADEQTAGAAAACSLAAAAAAARILALAGAVPVTERAAAVWLLQDARAALQMMGEGMADSGTLNVRHAWALARCEEALISGLLDNADRKART